jgi:hypothetical protein
MFFIIKAITVALSSESCLFSKLEVVFSVFIENNFVSAVSQCAGARTLDISPWLLPDNDPTWCGPVYRQLRLVFIDFCR